MDLKSSPENEQDSGVDGSVEIKCIFNELMQEISQEEVSNENLNDSETKQSATSFIENPEFSQSILIQVHASKSDCLRANETLTFRLSKSETESWNNLNNVRNNSASDCHLDNIDVTETSFLDERACFELKSNSAASREDFRQDEAISNNSAQSSSSLNSESLHTENHQMAIKSSKSSLESCKLDVSIFLESNENNMFPNKENDELQTATKTTNDVTCTSDLNMSVVTDRTEETFEKCLYKVNDAYGIKTCAQHDMNKTINSNLNENENENETKTEAAFADEKVTVCQDQIENTNKLQHASVNDMKAIVCQVLRTWAERQAESVSNHDPHTSVSPTNEETRNVTNVREYVKQIESSYMDQPIKCDPTNKKELYTKILHEVLEKHENAQALELREETLQLLDETDNEEQWKQKFHEILHMFQDLANKMKNSNTTTNTYNKCFNYLTGPEEEGKFD